MLPLEPLRAVRAASMTIVVMCPAGSVRLLYVGRGPHWGATRI